jgi:hypothetical protein
MKNCFTSSPTLDRTGGRGGRQLRGAVPVIGWPGARLAGAGGRGEGGDLRK